MEQNDPGVMTPSLVILIGAAVVMGVRNIVVVQG